MNLNFTSINFKGYDALPLKAIHVEEFTSSPIREELREIAQQENFEIRSGLDYCKWAQDFKMIIERNKKPFIIANNRVDLGYLEEVKRKYNIESKSNDFIATGGNSFIGKYPNGEKWMLIGIDELDTKSLEYISQEYNVKKENIFPIPQQNYHLDMFMRPIGYPYVLVDSPILTSKNLSKINWKNHAYEYLTLEKAFRQQEADRQRKYSSSKETIEALKQAGFKPIAIAGNYGSGINFMNAIVNQHQNGTISYITNGTKCESDFVSNFEKLFETELRQKVPNLDKIYFVRGMEAFQTKLSNYMMDNLAYRGGGIHCMTMEEPDFDVWG